MFRRILLFVATNIAIIVMASLIFFIIEGVFGVNISGYANGNLVWLAIFALVYGFIWSFVSLSISRWMAKKAYRIQLIDESSVLGADKKTQLVYNTVSQIATANNITMPEVGIYQSGEANAFATWPSKNKSLVAVSTGLLQNMNDTEIQWVVGHEMAHILNGDMVTMTLLQWVMNAFVIFFARIVANIVVTTLRWDGEGISIWIYYLVVIVLELVFGALAMLILMKFSRWREFRADAGSSSYLGRDKMIASLERLKQIKENAVFNGKKTSFDPSKISNSHTRTFLFASHPPLQKRIDALTLSTFS